jgi:hypothetical protein
LHGLSASDLLANTASVGARPHRERQRRAKCKTRCSCSPYFYSGRTTGLGYPWQRHVWGATPRGGPLLGVVKRPNHERRARKFTLDYFIDILYKRLQRETKRERDSERLLGAKLGKRASKASRAGAGSTSRRKRICSVCIRKLGRSQLLSGKSRLTSSLTRMPVTCSLTGTCVTKSHTRTCVTNVSRAPY